MSPDTHDQLSPNQRREFANFQALVLALQQSNSSKSQEGGDGIDDESTLLRFFQARKCDAQQAYDHFYEVHESRRVNEINDLYAAIDLGDYEETAALYPQWSGRRDKRGLPMYLFDLAGISTKAIAAHKTSSKLLSATMSSDHTQEMAPMEVRRACAIHEHLTRFVFPLCAAVSNRTHHEIPIVKQLIIADITGISLKKIWQLRDYIQSFSKILSVHYPEVLDRVLVVGAPYYMSTILSWVQNWVDPVTFAKLQLVEPADLLPTLTSLIDISNVPKKYGGGFDAPEESWPVIDAAIQEALKWRSADRSIPRGPILWKSIPEGSKAATVVGSENGKIRQSTVAVLSK